MPKAQSNSSLAYSNLGGKRVESKRVGCSRAKSPAFLVANFFVQSPQVRGLPFPESRFQKSTQTSNKQRIFIVTVLK